PRRLLLRAERPDGIRAGRDRVSGAATGRPGGLDASARRAVGCPDTHGVGGDVPGLAGLLSGRRWLWWPDTDLPHPLRDRKRPTDNTRAVPAQRPWRRPGAAGHGRRRVETAVCLRHPDRAAD